MNPPDPTFSVLIATYNQVVYIEETLRSVEAQSFDDYELVVVNDGSTDETEALVTAWMDGFRARSGKRSVLSTTANGGQSAAFEHGFSLCRGRYVCLLDSDDRWLPEKLAAVARLVEEDPGAGMIVHPLLVIDADGRPTGDVRPMRARLSEGDLREQMQRTARQIAPATTGVVIRADVLQSLLPMPTRSFKADADAYLTFGASLLAPVRVLSEPLGEYRMHPGGHYLWRALHPEGLRYFVELQLVIARHFGLEAAARNNSYFIRHVFALEKFEGGPRGQLRALRELIRATFADPAFSLSHKLSFAGFWTACALAPRPLFERLWRAFQLRHTGHHRIASTRGEIFTGPLAAGPAASGSGGAEQGVR